MRAFSFILLIAAIVVGSAIDTPRPRPPVTIGGYRVLAVDFHTHSSMWSNGALTPWGLVLEAERQGLDAIAITGHNEVFDGKLGRWFSRLVGGPIVLAGEEILSPPRFHLIAVGIDRVVRFNQSAASALDEVHAQGGLGIAAHPVRDIQAGYDRSAMARLDASEICHPLIYARAALQHELEEFAARKPMAAIGSSDFHGLGRMGLCRTYVFVRENTEQGILEAVRDRRTVVYGRDGRAYGDPRLAALAAAADLEHTAPPNSRGTGLDWLSRIAGLLGLAGVLTIKERSG